MLVSPSNLGGGFTWTNYCCSLSGNGYMFSYGCNGSCSCSGCSAQGYYQYEGYQLGASGGSCGCTGNPEENPNPGPSDPYAPVLGFVGVDFSKSVIFFEDEYANTPQETVPWRSTESALCCSASGGQYGGHVKIEISGADNLVQYGGYPLSFEADLDPYEEIAFTNTYRAVAASGSAEDIIARGSFVSNDATSDWRMDSMDKATAVKVEIEPVVCRDECENRHRMGVREEFYVRVTPAGVMPIISMAADWNQIGDAKFECPIRTASNGISIEVKGSTYCPPLSVIEPIGIVCSGGFRRCADGYIAMALDPYVTPLDVCFSGVKVMEMPTDRNGPSGYFTNSVFASIWYHSISNGAGVWYRPGRDNHFFDDEPSFAEYCPPPIREGVIDWLIQLAWAEDDAATVDDRVGIMPMNYHQVFTLDALGGLRIDKFTQWIKCTADGIVTSSPGIR